MSKAQGLMFGLATVALVGLATFYFTKPWLPELQSDRGAIDSAMAVTLLVTGAVFILTNLILAWFSWRYQDHEGAQALYWHDNPRLEWTWTLVTAAILFVFLFNALDLWAKVQRKAPGGAMVVEVTGQQFAWNVRYPGKDGAFGRTDTRLVDPETSNFIGLDKEDPASGDDLVLLNELYLPQGQPVRVVIRSMDVIHSFFLPNFRVKQDAVPGMTTQFWFTPTRRGNFELACAELCGVGHYIMRGRVVVETKAAFDAWLAQQSH